MLAVTANITALFPAFLLGSLSVFIRQDLHLRHVEVGAAVGIFFLAVCLTSVPNGRLVERLGVRLALKVFAFSSSIVMLGFAIAGHGFASLMIISAVSGILGGFGQLVANLALGWGVPERSLGLAFGISQSAIPAAAFVAGLLVPFFGADGGWRWGFVCGAVISAAFGAASPRLAQETRTRHDSADDFGRPSVRGIRHPERMTSLWLLALASGFGSVATIPVLTFLVSGAVRVGFSSALAGLVLAVVCGLTVAVRVGLGTVITRVGTTRHLTLVASMLLVGAVGTAALALDSADKTLFLVAVTLSLAVGNGWQGLLFYSVVLKNGDSPAAASAVLLAGGSLGAAFGPLIFGVVVEVGSFGAAWATTAAAGVVAAMFMLIAKPASEGKVFSRRT